LIKIGAERISSLSDQNKRAIACNEQYDKLRKEVLEARKWNFNLKRQALSQDATAPAFGYSYRYQLPSDCIKPWNVYDSSGYENKDNWVEENGFILTDWATVNLLYGYNLTDTTKFSAMFDEALALAIAADIAYHVVQSLSLSEKMLGAYDDFLRSASTSNAQTGVPDEPIEGDWITSRL